MNFCTARVAPEKAVFRPALPLHPLPGITGMQMGKTVYIEQQKLLPGEQALKQAIEIFPREMACSLAALLIGYGEEYVHSVFWGDEVDDRVIQAGRLAWQMGNYSTEECHVILSCFRQLGPDKFIEVIREAVLKDKGMN